MTEEIIIDGVNVEGCKYYDYCTTNDCQIDDSFRKCEGENCYYKQLRRLEQENKKLKETKGRCAFKCLDNTFCDEARIKIDKLELDKDCLNASLETARKYRGIAEVERDKYRSALEEIKEIAEKYKDTEGCKIPLRAILTLIDEVL